jgi:hypothetical protein
MFEELPYICGAFWGLIVGENLKTSNHENTAKEKHEPQHSDLTDILNDIKQHLGLILVCRGGSREISYGFLYR